MPRNMSRNKFSVSELPNYLSLPGLDYLDDPLHSISLYYHRHKVFYSSQQTILWEVED